MKRTTEHALIIFVKNPIKGKVKSRLAKTIGEKKALEVYQLLLEHTRNITANLSYDKFVFYHDFIPKEDIWESKSYHKYKQQGDDLGKRMQQAFQMIFDMGYKAAVIIGSDCYELKTAGIEMAFELLGDNRDKQYKKPVVIGPANDGGYYLLAIQQLYPEIFGEIPWSTSEVLEKTLQKLRQQDIPIMLLPILTDIDIETDLPDELKIKTGLLNAQITD